jgi:hypothetical protein
MDFLLNTDATIFRYARHASRSKSKSRWMCDVSNIETDIRAVVSDEFCLFNAHRVAIPFRWTTGQARTASVARHDWTGSEPIGSDARLDGRVTGSKAGRASNLNGTVCPIGHERSRPACFGFGLVTRASELVIRICCFGFIHNVRHHQ